MSYFREALLRHTTRRVEWTTEEQRRGPRISARRAAKNMALGELLTTEARVMVSHGYDAIVEMPEDGDHQRQPYVLRVSPIYIKEELGTEYPASLTIRLHPEPADGFLCDINFVDAAGQRVMLTMASIHLDHQTVHYWLHAFYDLALTAQLHLAEAPSHLQAGTAAAHA